MTHLRLAVLLVIALAQLGCGSQENPGASKSASAQSFPEPSPPDVGNVTQNLNCAAKPRRNLSPRELCEIEAFKSRCTSLDDCYVSCLSSPQGVLVGGGCGHVCTLGLHAGAPYPTAVSACASVPGNSGL